jgi:hypothetical protein
VLRQVATFAAIAACSAAARPEPLGATGTIAGAAWSGHVVSGTYCTHCAGGLMIFVAVRSPDRPEAISVSIDTPPCAPGHRWTEPIARDDGSRVRVTYGDDDRGWIDAVAGEIDVAECSEARIRLRLRARFEDDSEVAGTLDVPLTYSAGYD